MGNKSSILTDSGQRNDFSIFESLEKNDHEQIAVCSDKPSGLKALIAIHNTVLGPALGGVRMWPYDSEEMALRDVLRLSRGMTYKASIAGINFGGGKAVIIGDPKKHKSEALLRAYGRFVEGLGGRYITAEDVGMQVRDMDCIRMETRHVTGVSTALGGSGDPSLLTALGVYMGMKAAARKAFGSDELGDRKIAIQGAGNVSSHLVRYLHKEGAGLYVSDIDPEKVDRVVRETGATAVDADKIYDLDVDIFSPCALGGILNEETIPRLKCAVIAGAANNQLGDEMIHGPMLMEKGMLYAPDYVINAGGVINLSVETEGYDRDYAREKVERIYDTLMHVFEYASGHRLPVYEASNRLAEARLEQVGRVKSIYTSRDGQSGY